MVHNGGVARFFEKNRSGNIILALLFLMVLAVVNGCVIKSPNPFDKYSQPLRETTLFGDEPGKILVISVKGVISDTGKGNFLSEQPSMVEEVVSQLRLAAQDQMIRAVVLKVDSPGGTTTASDILYNELLLFKKRTGKKLVVMMMDMATSGGYYISLPADYIIAHPTTLTGSIGVIFMRPLAPELMKKIGVSMDIVKSGEFKDMGSPFRMPTGEEKAIFQKVTSDLGGRFLSLVKKHRKLNPEQVKAARSARIFLGDEAVAAGLIDQTGYLEEALDKARSLANLSPRAKIVVYRRNPGVNDTLYSSSTTRYPDSRISLVNIDLLSEFQHLGTGFFYLWAPGAESLN